MNIIWALYIKSQFESLFKKNWVWFLWEKLRINYLYIYFRVILAEFLRIARFRSHLCNSYRKKTVHYSLHKKTYCISSIKHPWRLFSFETLRCGTYWRNALTRGWHTKKNTVISPGFLVLKFCGKAQFPHSFGWFAVSFRKISTPWNQVKLRYFSQWHLP